MAGYGQSLELFFFDGTPGGMLTAKIFNWTGQVLMTPRTQLAEALKRSEGTGVYILLDEGGENGKVSAYIGESENVGDRIRTHDARIDWWTKVVVITSAANDLHKAHVKYLEARLLDEARRAKVLELTNGNIPACPAMPEASKANMEQFLDHLLLVLPAIRVDGFLVKTRPPTLEKGTNAQAPLSALFELKTPLNGVAATAKLENGAFVVQPGSVGRADWQGPNDHAYRRLFEEVVASGAYVPQGANRAFTQAYVFNSPSAAGAVLNGRSTNGQVAWKLSSDPAKTYREWEMDQLQK